MSYENIRFHVDDDGVAHVVLNRPKAANAFSLQLAQELADIAKVCDSDRAIRAVVLTGEGRFFSAGGDLSEFSTAGDKMDRALTDTTLHLHAAVSRFHRMDPPVIMAVNGTAAGGGFSLAISGDIVVAAKSAKFTMGYSRIALSPDGTSTYFLPRLVGLRRAQELMMTDPVLTADEALAWGLVTKVVESDALLDHVASLARSLARGPTLAFGGAKRLLASSFTHPLETQAEFEARSIVGLTRTEDAKEGVAAFLEKRGANFGGR